MVLVGRKEGERERKYRGRRSKLKLEESTFLHHLWCKDFCGTERGEQAMSLREGGDVKVQMSMCVANAR